MNARTRLFDIQSYLKNTQNTKKVTSRKVENKENFESFIQESERTRIRSYHVPQNQINYDFPIQNIQVVPFKKLERTKGSSRLFYTKELKQNQIRAIYELYQIIKEKIRKIMQEKLNKMKLRLYMVDDQNDFEIIEIRTIQQPRQLNALYKLWLKKQFEHKQQKTKYFERWKQNRRQKEQGNMVDIRMIFSMRYERWKWEMVGILLKSQKRQKLNNKLRRIMKRQYLKKWKVSFKRKQFFELSRTQPFNLKFRKAIFN